MFKKLASKSQSDQQMDPEATKRLKSKDTDDCQDATTRELGMISQLPTTLVVGSGLLAARPGSASPASQAASSPGPQLPCQSALVGGFQAHGQEMRNRYARARQMLLEAGVDRLDYACSSTPTSSNMPPFNAVLGGSGAYELGGDEEQPRWFDWNEIFEDDPSGQLHGGDPNFQSARATPSPAEQANNWLLSRTGNTDDQLAEVKEALVVVKELSAAVHIRDTRIKELEAITARQAQHLAQVSKNEHAATVTIENSGNGAARPDRASASEQEPFGGLERAIDTLFSVCGSDNMKQALDSSVQTQSDFTRLLESKLREIAMLVTDWKTRSEVLAIENEQLRRYVQQLENKSAENARTSLGKGTKVPRLEGLSSDCIPSAHQALKLGTSKPSHPILRNLPRSSGVNGQGAQKESTTVSDSVSENRSSSDADDDGLLSSSRRQDVLYEKVREQQQLFDKKQRQQSMSQQPNSKVTNNKLQTGLPLMRAEDLQQLRCSPPVSEQSAIPGSLSLSVPSAVQNLLLSAAPLPSPTSFIVRPAGNASPLPSQGRSTPALPVPGMRTPKRSTAGLHLYA